MAFDVSKFLGNVQGEARRRAIAAGEKAVEQFAEHVVAQAQKITPVSPTDPKHPGYTGHSGALRDSGTAERAVVKRDRITCRVGFNAYYAAAVHERLDLAHKAPTRSKYLETAMRVEAPKLVNHVKQEMRKSL